MSGIPCNGEPKCMCEACVERRLGTEYTVPDLRDTLFRYDGEGPERGPITIVGGLMVHCLGRWHLGLDALVPMCEVSRMGFATGASGMIAGLQESLRVAESTAAGALTG